MESGEISDLVAGSKAVWDRFVTRYMPVVYAAVQRRLIPAGYGADCDDVVQEVFLKLCARDFHLVRNYDPAKAKISTWLTVIATSCSIDHLRRQKGNRQALDDTPEAELAVDPDIKERIKIPEGLLSPRQALVLDPALQEGNGSRRSGGIPECRSPDRALHAPQGLDQIKTAFSRA